MLRSAASSASHDGRIVNKIKRIIVFEDATGDKDDRMINKIRIVLVNGGTQSLCPETLQSSNTYWTSDYRLLECGREDFRVQISEYTDKWQQWFLPSGEGVDHRAQSSTVAETQTQSGDCTTK